MARRLLNNAMWEQLAAASAEVKDPRGAQPGLDDRKFIEAVVYLTRTGLPWRDLAAEVGAWSAAYVRFRRWEKAGVWQRLWEVLSRGATPALRLCRLPAAKYLGVARRFSRQAGARAEVVTMGEVADRTRVRA